LGILVVVLGDVVDVGGGGIVVVVMYFFVVVEEEDLYRNRIMGIGTLLLDNNLTTNIVVETLLVM
jgi:hypothetical protein